MQFSYWINLKSLLCTLALVPAVNVSASESEIEQASEAAPAIVTDKASYMAFREGKFHKIKEGANNFTCMVISDPNGRYEPACFNEQAMRSVFPTYEYYMKLLYRGVSYDAAYQGLEEAYGKGELPLAEHGALVYMMSQHNRYYDIHMKKAGPTPIHQMYFFPKLSDETFSLIQDNVYTWQGFPHLTALIVETK